LVGGLAGVLYTTVVPRRAEAWTLVVENGSAIQPRQLGAVSQAIFHSEPVYRPAMRALGLGESPQRFLATRVALQPVPQTNTLVVVGRGSTLTTASRTSHAMAEAFVG